MDINYYICSNIKNEKMVGKVYTTLIMFCLFVMNSYSAEFDKWFQNRTLRIDYIFSGDSEVQEVSLDEYVSFDGWAGKRSHLTDLAVDGNSQLVIKDKQTGTVIYRYSFSTLMQEWITTDEAKHKRKAFENPVLVPFPKADAVFELTFRDRKGNYNLMSSLDFDPTDMLVRNIDGREKVASEYILKNGSYEDCIDLIILPEGYSKEEKELFHEDAAKAVEILFSHNPFDKCKDRFNVLRVDTFSNESGVSIPRKGEWKNSVFKSHFDTFYSDRYLTTSRMKNLHEIIGGLHYEHIIVLVNTPVYGGGGIYNYYTLTSSRVKYFPPVLVHEFGHSFAGLGDEYYYEKSDDMEVDMYDTTVEPWEPNITTLVDFGSKWKDMVGKDVPVPTKVDDNAGVGAYEGGGYMNKGVYRPVYNECRMKNNVAKSFCPVCERAILKMIEMNK